MSKKTNKKQVSAKAKRAKGTAEAQAKSAKPKDGMSFGAKVALTVFAVLMALSMMLPSIAAIVGTSSSQDSSSQSQSADSGSSADSSDSGSSADSSDSGSSSDSSDGTTDAVAQADEKYQPLVDALETKLSSDSQNLATLLNLGKDYMAWGVTVRYSGSTDASTSHANELLEKAISYYDQYLALKDSGAVRVDRALCQYYEEETSEATAALEQLTQDMPDYGPAWANLGMLYESAGNSDQAREAYQKAQEADADDEYGAKTYATQRISAMDSAASSSAGATDSTSATTSGSSTTGSTGVKGLSDTLANLSGTSL